MRRMPAPSAWLPKVLPGPISFAPIPPFLRRVFLGAIVLLWLAVYGTSLFRPALLDDADSVHAEAAREMALGHDWVTLHVNGIRYLEKAPLFYWMTAASFEVLGVHDWSARLPLALGVLGLLYAVYFLGSRVFGERGGFYAALAAGLAFGPYIFTRFLIPSRSPLDSHAGDWQRPARSMC